MSALRAVDCLNHLLHLINARILRSLPTNPMIGQTISHYKILEKLGEGGMGVVYKAEDTTLDRFVALKFLPPNLQAGDQEKARFLQEAKAAAALNHPNICSVIAIEERDGRMFIVMEFVDGQTLRDKRGSITFKQAIDFGIQIAEGLAAAHEKGIVHRDIKPENIMVRKDGICQIMDFGLAKLRASGSKITRLTKEGSTVGTAGYMSPEQVQGQDTDHRSDIFSYGVLLYELLTGQLPFKGVHETALAYEIVNVDAAPMSALKPEIDPNLDSIVLECLEKDPRERTQSIAQTALDLKRYRRESSRQKMSRITAARPAYSSAGMPQQSGQDPDMAVRPQQEAATPNSSTIAWSVAILCALCLAGLAFVHFRETPPVLPSINASLIPPQKYLYNSDFGGNLALSPDGTMLAFVAADSTGKSTLWIRPLNSSSPRQLPETDDASFPFWSPESRFIGFFGGGKLKKVSAMGAPPITICDAPSGRGGTWNSAGVILFAPNFDLDGIHRVSASGGTPAQVTAVDSTRNETNHRWPCFLPDGNHFFYTSQAKIRTQEFTGAMYVASLDSGRGTLLTNVSSNMAYYKGYLLYVRQKAVVAQPFDVSSLKLSGDGSPIAERIDFSSDKSRGIFTISENGILAYQAVGSNPATLSIVDRSGKKIRDIGDRTLYTGARFSLDGTKVALDSEDKLSGTGDVWIYDLMRDLITRFTFDPSAEWSPIWSPGGDRIVYSSDMKGSGDLFIKSSNGSEGAKVLLKSLPPKTALDWSADGRNLLCDMFSSGTKRDLWVVPMDGTREPYPYLQTEFNEDHARFSPDGRWVAYDSDESGKTEVYVRPFPLGGGKWQISAGGGENPLWRADGTEIYYEVQGGKVWAVRVSGAGGAFTVGSAAKLFEIPRTVILDATRNGMQFLVASTPSNQSNPPVTLITNWDEALKSK
jgi:serine/threonine protein kinase